MTAPPLDINRRILVVDDNEAIQDDFRKILMPCPASADASALRSAIFGDEPSSVDTPVYEMESAYQGKEALDKVRDAVEAHRPYAIAFVDMRMPPGWDGLRTIEELWKVDPQLQAVICTAYSDYSWDEILQRLGQTDRLLILKKPFDTMEVSQLASALVEKWFQTRRASMKLEELEELVLARTQELESTNVQLKKQVDRRIEVEDQLRHEVTHDALTGLPNRVLLMDRLRQCAERAQRQTDYRYAVLFLDIDNFKVINDSMGHALGDELLTTVAARLQDGLRSLDSVVRLQSDTAARLGGDEFIVLLDGLKQDKDAVLVAERLQTMIRQPISIKDQELIVTVSIGIAVNRDTPCTPDVMVRDADTAMYRAKMAGKAQYAIFDEAMHNAVIARMTLENNLRTAWDNRQFSLMYQPIVNLATRSIYGYEALVRWEITPGSFIPPTEFIPITEETGLIVHLGRWIIEQACRTLKQWMHEATVCTDLVMSINLSKRQVIEPGIADQIAGVLADTGVPGDRIHMEITESVIMHDPVAIRDTLDDIRRLGIRLSMDDFGTGHSSLSCLHHFPIDYLKIDRSFVKTTQANPDYLAIIEAIITLAHNLDARVIAEGIEHDEQCLQLLSLHCDYGQGYLFAPPMNADDALDYLVRNHPLRRGA
jgi:diguanylate cyclase (GGDEF)-like protein